MRSILIALLITITVSIVYLSYGEGYFFSQKLDITPDKPTEYEIKEFLIPVTGFTSKVNSLSEAELRTAKFITLSSNLDLVPDEFKNNTSVVERIEDIDFTNSIALLTPNEVMPWYKTIQLENIKSFWSKDFDSEIYPFTKIFFSPIKARHAVERSVIFASGEIIPARAVDRLGLNKYDNYTYLFDSFQKDIKDADISIALLENAVLGNPAPCTGCMSFVSDDKVIKGISDVGFDMIATSGNHAGDAGQKAYLNTINLLNENKVEYTGTGNCRTESCDSVETPYDILKPAVKEINGRKIGMLAADDVAAYYWKSSETSGNFGTNSFSKIENGIYVDADKVKRVGEVKTKFEIDYLIIYMSWGVEYTNFANAHQQELGKNLIDAGADIIIGSHPHWVQNVEFYNGKPIIYGLGNFIFDQTHTLETRQGAAVNLYYFNNELKSIEIMPHQICGYHQTKNDLASKWIAGEIDSQTLNTTQESQGCVYWQPKKLDSKTTQYNEILNRIYEFSKII